MPSEADARIVIDQLLRDARWDIQDKSQVSTEEAAADGRADYLLKNTRTQPLAVIEAKKFSIDPYGAKERAKEYSVSLGAPFVILTCPLTKNEIACQRRVGKLYLLGRYFACRHCHDLTYQSCQDSHKFDKCLRALGAPTGLSAKEVAKLLTPSNA